MSSPNDDVFVNVIRTLANTTAVAISNGFPRLADATIELQYVITSRLYGSLSTLLGIRR